MNTVKQVFGRLGTFLGDVAVEFRRIAWPGRQELIESTVVVISFIVLLAVVVLVCDRVIQYVLQLIHA
jgi:preprotein translocase subunit SecE